MENPTFIIQEITAKETYAVRHPVLRKGKPLDACRFDGDAFATTFHLGAFDNNHLVGVVTLLEKPQPKISSQKSFQLRGMAVLQSLQKKGVGALLVSAAEDRIRQKNGTLIWMNAREIAVDFYAKLGYSKFGNAFDIPLIGLHFLMMKEFDS